MEHRPVFQVIALIFFQIAFCYYMVKRVSFANSKLDKILKIKECLIGFGQIAIFLLTSKIENEKYFDIIGWVIISLLGLAFLVEFGYMVIIQIFGFKQIVAVIKSKFQMILRPSRRNSSKPKPVNKPKIKTILRSSSNFRFNQSREIDPDHSFKQFVK